MSTNTSKSAMPKEIKAIFATSASSVEDTTQPPKSISGNSVNNTTEYSRAINSTDQNRRSRVALERLQDASGRDDVYVPGLSRMTEMSTNTPTVADGLFKTPKDHSVMLQEWLDIHDSHEPFSGLKKCDVDGWP